MQIYFAAIVGFYVCNIHASSIVCETYYSQYLQHLVMAHVLIDNIL